MCLGDVSAAPTVGDSHTVTVTQIRPNDHFFTPLPRDTGFRMPCKLLRAVYHFFSRPNHYPQRPPRLVEVESKIKTA